jgi:hypothetical protein
MDGTPRIGGFFEFDFESIGDSDVSTFTNWMKNESRTILLSTGRSALAQIVVPEYMCGNSIVPTCESLGLPYIFYSTPTLSLDSNVILNSIGPNTGYVLLINYFGLYRQDKTVAAIKEHFPDVTVIVDAVMDPYYMLDRPHKTQIADFEFTSLRKFFPTPDGAILRSRESLTAIGLNKDCSSFVDSILLASLLIGIQAEGQLRSELEQAALLHIKNHSKLLEKSSEPNRMHPLSELIMRRLNFELIRQRRRTNYARLVMNLQDSDKFIPCKSELRDWAVPLCLPVLVNGVERDFVRSVLKKQNIYCPVHWPFDFVDTAKVSSGSNSMYKNGLSLVIDQRYGAKEIDRISDILNTL